MTARTPSTRTWRRALAEEPAPYLRTGATAGAPFPEATLTALWLLGRIPSHVLEAALPARLLRPGRAGRGPGPDVREAAFLAPSGATVAGDVEVHLRASDFVRHGHAEDPAYRNVVLHLCWQDDRAAPDTPTALPGGGAAPTVALGRWLAPTEVERLVGLGPDLAVVTPPCAGPAHPDGDALTTDAVRDEGRKRFAERTWRAWRLADRYGFDGALTLLLERAVASSAGRIRESEERRAEVVAAILAALGPDPVESLARLAHAGRPALIGAMRAGAGGGETGRSRTGLARTGPSGGLGAARAAEVAWNVALPLVAALAAAYDDVALARQTATLADAWPAPRPYGRTRALSSALTGAPHERPADGPAPPRPGALYAQGLLHLQDLWCSRGGCGACPLSPPHPDEREVGWADSR